MTYRVYTDSAQNPSPAACSASSDCLNPSIDRVGARCALFLRWKFICHRINKVSRP